MPDCTVPVEHVQMDGNMEKTRTLLRHRVRSGRKKPVLITKGVEVEDQIQEIQQIRRPLVPDHRLLLVRVITGLLVLRAMDSLERA